MRHTPHYLLTDPAEVARLVRENPWVIWVSPAEAGLVASPYPTLVDETADGLELLTHFGRPDEVGHELGRHEVMAIVQGPHGYISPSWYPDPTAFVPTWNHVTAHLYGTPELLEPEENLAVLERLVDAFERHVEAPRSLRLDPADAARQAKGTIGLRMRVTRFEARAKLSQNKTPETRAAILAALRGGGPYAQPALADAMERLAPITPEIDPEGDA
ncbi:MAG: FMN-binding negative transcriptional regulator [Actinomycetales bacterium]|nr:FMN-binding negative transcriptional regulator [Actinomycetales bacterium]